MIDQLTDKIKEITIIKLLEQHYDIVKDSVEIKQIDKYLYEVKFSKKQKLQNKLKMKYRTIVYYGDTMQLVLTSFTHYGEPKG